MSEKAQSTQTGLRSKLVQSTVSENEYNIQFEQEAAAFEAVRE